MAQVAAHVAFAKVQTPPQALQCAAGEAALYSVVCWFEDAAIEGAIGSPATKMAKQLSSMESKRQRFMSILCAAHPLVPSTDAIASGVSADPKPGGHPVHQTMKRSHAP